jgi:Leucine-rich repeat (LRR) protein
MFSVINLSHNRLNKLPRLQEQSEMEELDVSTNKLSAIESDDLMQLKSLKTLRLSENFIGMLIDNSLFSALAREHLSRVFGEAF